MSKLSISAAIISIYITASLGAAVSQSATTAKETSLPAVSSEEVLRRENQLITEIYPSQLAQNALNIYEQTGGGTAVYTYLPYAYVDWSIFSNEVKRQCASDSPDIRNVRIVITFYWPELIAEIKRMVSERLSKPSSDFAVAIPPNVGVLGFVYNHTGNPFQAINTVPRTDLLRGVPLTSISPGIPAEIAGWVDATCKDLMSIADRQELTTLMFAVGSKAKVSQLTAAADTLLHSNFISDLKNIESQVKKTEVSSNGSGGNLGFNAGPLMFGGSAQTARSTVDEQHFRIINRAWLDSSLERAVTNIRANVVCDGECPEKTIDGLFTLFFGQLKSQQVEIDTSSADAWRAKYNAVSLPIDKINVSEELKSALNQIAKGNEKTGVNVDGMEFKNENDKSVTLNSDINFKKNGEEWVPTTLTAYVVNVLDLERSVNIEYQQTIIGSSSNIAIKLPMLSTRPPAINPTVKFVPTTMPDPDVVKKLNALAQAMFADVALRPALAARKPVVYGLSLPNQRLVDTVYKNGQAYPIIVEVAATSASEGSNCSIFVYIDEQLSSVNIHAGLIRNCEMSFVVYPKMSYKVIVSPETQLMMWTELR